MSESGDSWIVVTQPADIAARDLFAVLRDPRRHPQIDGSGMVQAHRDAVPVTGVGDVFTMAMRYPSLGDYETDNHVTAFETDRLIAWTTARHGRAPAGVIWSWELRPGTSRAARTIVVHRYDWSGVHDPAVLARVSFPRVGEDAMVRSVANLISAASGSDPGPA